MLIDAEKLRKSVKGLYVKEILKDDYIGRTTNITLSAVLRLIEIYESKGEEYVKV